MTREPSARARARAQATSEYGRKTAGDTIVFERLLPGPVERVWAYLTESDKRAKWLAAGEMELRPGGRVELTFRHAELSRHDEPTPEKYKPYEGGVTATGHVTRCEPPRLLAITWAEDAGSRSEVVFELTPRDGDVLLTLTHRRLKDRAEMVDAAGGWHTHLAMLVDNLEGEEPRPFWGTLIRVEPEYERRFPADEGQ
jgi:uncharacterized protein YndB with AHSA1/START domain